MIKGVQKICCQIRDSDRYSDRSLYLVSNIMNVIKHVDRSLPRATGSQRLLMKCRNKRPTGCWGCRPVAVHSDRLLCWISLNLQPLFWKTFLWNTLIAFFCEIQLYEYKCNFMTMITIIIQMHWYEIINIMKQMHL